MVNRIETVYLRGLNKGLNLRFFICSQDQQETPEEGQRAYWPKCSEYNDKDEVNCLNI